MFYTKCYPLTKILPPLSFVIFFLNCIIHTHASLRPSTTHMLSKKHGRVKAYKQHTHTTQVMWDPKSKHGTPRSLRPSTTHMLLKKHVRVKAYKQHTHTTQANMDPRSKHGTPRKHHTPHHAQAKALWTSFFENCIIHTHASLRPSTTHMLSKKHVRVIFYTLCC